MTSLEETVERLQNEVARLRDREEIRRLFFVWSEAAGRCDWETFRNCYHEDAVVEAAWHRDIATRDEFVDWMKVYHSEIQQTIFFNTNVLIEFTGQDLAFAESHALALQRYTADARDARIGFLGPEYAHREVETDVFFTGRYLDQVERRDGTWRLLRRETVFETIQGSEARVALPHRSSGMVVSERDREDPLWAARDRLGLGPLENAR